MQYAKLIKHPLPPVKPEYIEYSNNNSQPYDNYIYHAEVLEGVLAVTIMSYSKHKKIEIDSRHFYDGEKYATQRVSDNKRLSGALPYYVTYGKGVDNADEIIDAYVKDAVNGDVYKKCGAVEGITTLYYVEQNMLEDALKLRHKKITDKVDQRMEALAEKPPQEFYNWAEEWVLKDARYFFYSYKKGKTQKGYCSHCGAIFEAADVKHNSKICCPSCGSLLTCKALGKSSQRIDDCAGASYIEEITENGVPTLVERIFVVKQKIEGHREGIENMQKTIICNEIRRQFFNAITFDVKPDSKKQSYYAYGYFRKKGDLRWCGYEDCYGADDYIEPKIFPKNIDSIFKNSKLPKIQNIEVSAITPYCEVRFKQLVNNCLKHMPVLENFAKLGFHKLLQDIADCYKDYPYFLNTNIDRYIKKGCKTVYETLGIPKDTMNRLGDIGLRDYLLYKDLEHIAPIKIETLMRYIRLGVPKSGNNHVIFYVLRNYKITAEKLIGYLEKQCRLVKKNVCTILNTYYDYLSMAKDLRLPKTESVLFPKNVNVEHDRLVQIKSDREYKKQDAMLKKRVKILEVLSYQTEEFLIRPLRSSADFLKESSVLNHCVKTYIDRCANGKTNIFGIRRSGDPKTPYFTLQLSNDGKVITNLGKNNCQPPKEVKNFVNQWAKKVIAKNKKKFIEAANGKPQKVRATA